MNDIDRALSDGLIRTIKRNDQSYTYSVQLGTLNPVISFKLIRLEGKIFDCLQSHYISTACQIGPYCSSHTTFEGKGLTLHRAISKLTFYYRKAIAKNYVPRDEWLRPAMRWSESAHR
jgi:hypothetical protein